MPKYNDFDLDIQNQKLDSISISKVQSAKCESIEPSCNSQFICQLPKTENRICIDATI